MKYYNHKFNPRYLALAMAFTIISILQSCSPTENNEDVNNNVTTEIKYPVVSTIEATTQLFEHYFEVQGAIKANKNVIVNPEVGGIISSIRVRAGQNIKKGQIIATFNSDMASSNLDELEERIDVAKYMYEKQKTLNEKGVGTEIALKQAEGQYKALLKTKSTLNKQIGKYALHAPFTGFVEEVFPVAGQLAGPSSPIIRLIDLKDMSVIANISESYLKNLELNNLVNLTFPALDDTINKLKLFRIGKMVNPIDRTLPIEVRIPNPTDKMVPNLMAVLKIRDYIKEEALVIPSRTILKNANQEDFTLVLQEDNTVKAIIIKTGQIYNNKTEIIGGLNVGDQIIDRGSRKVVSGDKVMVQN